MRVKCVNRAIYVLTVLLFSRLVVSQVVLTPSNSNADPKQKDTANTVAAVEANNDANIAKKDAESDLVIGDHLVCNTKECYPIGFVPSTEWKEIRPGQRLPPGLDIRVSLEKGVREAKLPEPGSENIGNEEEDVKGLVLGAEGSTLSESELKETSEDLENEQSGFKLNNAEKESDILQQETDLKIAVSDNAEATSNEPAGHEFSEDFAKIKSLMQSPDEKTWEEVETLLDDLVEFAHDYKKGFKILSNEFELLEYLSFDDTLSIQIRELAARIIVSSLRNNPPSIDFVNEKYPQTTFKLCEHLSELQASQGSKLLIKRFLSILDVLLSRTEYVSIKDDVLWRLYQIEDPSSKIKILEIIAKFYNEKNEQVIDTVQQDMKTVQKWVNELTTIIQTPELDELHLRSFFHCISFIKTRFKNRVKIDSDFLNWLIDEIEVRNEKSKDDIYKRDVDQLEFDNQLAKSRHAVFGNPNAARLKERLFDDDDTLIADEL